MGDGKVKVKEVIEKNKNIVRLKMNGDATYLILQTDENKYYLYSILDEFLFDKFSRAKVQSVNIFFSPSSDKIFMGLQNGNIFE